MRLLLIDDDDNKVQQISAYVIQEQPAWNVDIRRSFQSGLRAIVTERPHIVLLDMTMPTYDVGTREPGGTERRYAGREILRQMERRALKIPTIVITQYEQFEEDGREMTLEELTSILHSRFPGCFFGTIFYQASGTSWMVSLRQMLVTLSGVNPSDS